ncbi:unnamed protein product, partial [marine sediment metagenome]
KALYVIKFEPYPLYPLPLNKGKGIWVSFEGLCPSKTPVD